MYKYHCFISLSVSTFVSVLTSKVLAFLCNFWVVVDGCGCLWVVVSGCGWLLVIVDSCG